MESALQALPTQINGYSLRSVIQQTAYSTSYLGLDEASQEQVLVIIYSAQASDENIQKAKDLAASPLDTILPIYDAGSAEGFLYVSCQYLEENTLENKLLGNMPQEEALECLQKIAHALNDLHQQGIYHGNLNPSCIHFDSAGKVYLSHFHIQANKNTLQAVGEQTDNPSFSAPESFKGEAANQAGDTYSLGLIAYSALTGTNAFQAETPYETALLQLQSTLPSVDALPQSLQGFVQLACKKNPALRPSNFDALGSHTDITAKEPSLGNDTLSIDADERRSAIKMPKNKTTQNTKSKVPVIAVSTSIALLGFSAAVYVAPQHDALSSLLPIHDAISGMLNPGQAEIATLLAKGQTQIDQQAYLDAAKTYQQVLGLKAQQATAVEKINWLVNHYLEQAYASLDTQDFSAADIHINHALDIDNKHAAIPPAQALYDELLLAKLATDSDAAAQLEAQRIAKEKAAIIAANNKAEAQEKKRLEQLAAAADAEAQAAAKAKADAQAAENARALAAQLAEEERIKQAKIAAALAKAAEMQADINRRNQLLSKVKITGLLKKAETYYARGNYHAPAKENALEKYQEVVSLDANNNTAIAGLDKTVTAIIPELVKLFENDQFSQGKLLFDQLKAASPNNEKLNIFAGAQGL